MTTSVIRPTITVRRPRTAAEIVEAVYPAAQAHTDERIRLAAIDVLYFSTTNDVGDYLRLCTWSSYVPLAEWARETLLVP